MNVIVPSKPTNRKGARMKMLAAGLLIAALSLSTHAETGFFSSKSPLPATDSAAEQSADRLFKLAPGCDFTLEIGDHHTRVTDSKGNSHLYTYFDDGRLARVISANSDVSIVYESNSRLPIAAIDAVTGKSRVIARNDKGPDYYREMLAAGRLPSPDKFVLRICSTNGNKQSGSLDDPLVDEWTNPDFWTADMAMDYDLSTFGLDQIADCSEKKAACHAQCERAFNIRNVSCIGIGAIAADMAGNLVGAAVLAVCSWANGDRQATCHANCESISC